MLLRHSSTGAGACGHLGVGRGRGGASRLKVIRLGWLSEHLGRPAVAVADPPPGVVAHDVVPPGAIVFRIHSPSAADMIHAPATVAGPLELDPDDQRWTDRFLSRAITDPTLSEADVVDALGPDRDALAHALLRLWSWIPEIDDRGQRIFPNLPMAPFMNALAACAEFYRLPASAILRDWSFQEFVFNWRIARQASEEPEGDELTRRVGIE